MAAGDDEQAGLVFNLVWTERAFEYLGLFTLSLLACSRARVRFVANGCAPEELATMERFTAAHPDRIADVVVVATDRTLRHGDALDAVRRQRDDGARFCFVDPDIAATGEFLPALLAALPGHVALTSGRELSSDGNVLPEGHPGLNGEYFFRADGYVFGSPHLAIYDAAALADTVERWHIGFGEGGSGLSGRAREALQRAGHDHLLYDTGKLVNIFLQLDGGALCHLEHDELVHVGGLLHYLWAPRDVGADGEVQVDWASWPGMTARHEVARYAAATIRALLSGAPAPDTGTADPSMAPRLERVRTSMAAVVAAHGDEWLSILGRVPGPEAAAASSYHAMRGFGTGRGRRR